MPLFVSYGPHCEKLKLNVVEDMDTGLEYDDEGDGNSSIANVTDNRKVAYPGMAVFLSLLCLSVIGVLFVIQVKAYYWVPVIEIHVTEMEDSNDSVPVCANREHHYMDDIIFFDEGIIVPGRLETVNEDAEFI
jgi:hypothetical protein